MSFGTTLRAARTDCNLTLEQLAEVVGLSIPRLSRIERDRELPSDQLVRTLAAAVSLPAEALLVEVASPVERPATPTDRFVAYRRIGGQR